MRVLILGGDGMLGHQLLRQWTGHHEVRTTLRREPDFYHKYNLFNNENSYFGVDVLNLDNLINVLAEFKPEAVVNAIGIIKQQNESKEVIPSIEINALYPHRLSALCKVVGARLVHMSTDCVFSGRKGLYKDNDTPDAEDLYGKTKLLGELHYEHCITLRTSIIGTELSRKKSLVEWFLAQKNDVKGYCNAIFSGFTTIEMARIIERLLVNYPDANGLYNVSSTPISKNDLLVLLRDKLGISTNIVADNTIIIDRSLDSTRFQKKFSYTPPAWESMINELVDDIKRNR